MLAGGIGVSTDDDCINADMSNGGIDAPAADIGASAVGAPASVDHLKILVGGIGVSSDDSVSTSTDDDRGHANMLAGGMDIGASAADIGVSTDDRGHANMLAGGIDIGASAAVGAPAFAPV